MPLYTINPYLETDAGDLFSLAWSNSLQTIYIGCQNTSLQWLNFRSLPPPTPDPQTGASTPSRKAHKFFDSYPQFEHKPADIHARNSLSRLSDALSRVEDLREGGSALMTGENCHIPATNVIDSAHYGYVYCMALIPSSRDTSSESITHKGQKVHLVTGSGDETVKVCLFLDEAVRVVEGRTALGMYHWRTFHRTYFHMLPGGRPQHSRP
jgi:di- and tripeptidase